MEIQYIIVPDHIFEYTFANFVLPPSSFYLSPRERWAREGEPLDILYFTIHYDFELKKFYPVTMREGIQVQVVRESDYKELIQSGLVHFSHRPT